MVCHQQLILKGMFGAYSDDGLKGTQSPVGFLASGLSPGHFFLQYMEQGNNISEAAADVSASGRGHAKHFDVPLNLYVAIGDRDHDNF